MTFKGEIAKLLFYIFRLFPIKNNKIVIDNYAGKGFGDNGKYIALELLKRNDKNKYDIVWITKDLESHFPKGIRVVPYISLKSIYEQATAKIWIDNLRKAYYIRKRKKQYYIMTWHGGIGPKKIEKEVEDILGKEYVNSAKHDSRMADLFLAESDFTYNKYRKFFWYSGEILKCGAPRQDVFFHDNKVIKQKILSSMGINNYKKIFLYAPTFRDNMSENDLYIYKRQWKRILTVVSQKFGGEWIGFIRLHPNIAKLDKNRIFEEDYVYDVTNYPDMQELLVASDIVLTDYSSCVYDFGLTGKPGFMIAEDIELYKKQRDLCLDLNVIPFPIASSDEELVHIIENFDYDVYSKKIHDFYYNYCGLYSGGHASEIVCDRIDQMINENM